MAQALKIQGRVGRHDHINGTYEPTGQQHNGKATWVIRGVASLYIFHTGKARWVVGRRLDDGARCFGFWKDESGKAADPIACKSPMVLSTDEGEWKADPKVSVVGALHSGDSFLALRMTIDKELDTLGLNTPDSLKAMWKRLDFNGNNVVSLAEIDKLVVEMTQQKHWPEWLNNKPALMRAYKKTIGLDSVSQDDFVHKDDFHNLMLNIFWFNKLWKIFAALEGDDRRVDMGEFQKGMSLMGLNLSGAEATAEFKKMDSNGGGQVLFVEFCAYVRQRVNPDHNPKFDADIVSGENCLAGVRKAHGHKATHTHYVSKKCFKDFDELEAKIKALGTDKKKLKDMWRHLDYNGNNVVSLAEIDKWVIENYALLNHKPALMRCYKCTIANGLSGTKKHDDYVHRSDFKRLITNIFYFNKLYWVFAEANDGDDNDRRMEFPEFKKCLTMCKVNISEADAKKDFGECDKNGGGMILFDEFCHYFASRSCPDGMTEFLDDGVDRAKDGTEGVLKSAGHARYHATGHGHVALNKGQQHAHYESSYGHHGHSSHNAHHGRHH